VKAIVWEGEDRFVLGDVPRPAAGRGQVLVKVGATAICGSDLNVARFGERPPLVPGHEGAGTVEELGDGAEGVEIGARVALDPVQRCGKCPCCESGIGHLCLNVRHLGGGETPGTWAEYVAVDATNAHPIPPGVDLAAASLTEPVAVCYESFQRAGLREGESVLVIGDGPFGFLHAQLARALGAGKIVVAGHYEKRLARIGAATGAAVCNTRGEDLGAFLSREVTPPGVDVAVVATGAGVAPNLGLRALRPRGTLVIFSYVWRPEPLEMGLILMRELNVLGSCRSLRAFGTCLDMMAAGKIDAADLVDLRIPMEEFADAIEALKERKGDLFKAVLFPGGAP